MSVYLYIFYGWARARGRQAVELCPGVDGHRQIGV